MWNWQQANWPKFEYDIQKLSGYEREFTLNVGKMLGISSHLPSLELENLKIQLISDEALKTSKIEGELLNRDSVQYSICKHFGLQLPHHKVAPAEAGIAAMMVDLYQNFAAPLSEDLLFKWHKLLVNGRQDMTCIGSYRNDEQPMQVVSGPIYAPKVHFEAPPSHDVKRQMDEFIKWYNDPSLEISSYPVLKAGVAHLYFLCIHPFEDGNGRIARAISEKILSQYLGYPSLIALSYTIEQDKKSYYKLLEVSNQELLITSWLEYFSQVIISAQHNSLKRIEFIVAKAKFYNKFSKMLNERQLKVIERIFKEGLNGFEGGLSADNYISISKASRATATRDLNAMVDLGAFTKTGQLRHTRYYLNLL